MTALVGALRVTLGANTAQYEAGMRRASRITNREADQIKRTLRNLAGSFAAFFSARELVRMTDTFTRFRNSLRVAGVEGEEMARVQEALFTSAQRFGVELEALGTLYSRASQAAAGLGASQAELLSFTDNVAAAVRVQGGTVEQASGALLQLSQALQSGTVRAEEFNSINEGLFPVLQAVAAGSDRFGGSVARLRRAVIEGEVSSREFFEAFQRGSVTLQERANRAALTTTAAFTQLRNALTVYLGEANEASGASIALGNAIRLLADNLNTLIPALGVLGLGLGVGFVSRAVAARAAATGAATAMGTLAAAGRGVVGVFGGPVGIAITAVVVALGSLSVAAAETEAAMARLEGGVDQARVKLDEARDRAERAGVAVDQMADETRAAHPVMLSIAQALDIASDAARRYAENARIAAIASAQLRMVQAQADVDNLERTRRRQDAVARNAPLALRGAAHFFTGTTASRAELDAAIAAGRAQINLTREELRLLQLTPDSAFDRPASPTEGSDGKRRSRNSRADRERERAIRDEFAFFAEMRHHRMEQLGFAQQATQDFSERFDLGNQITDLEREQYRAELQMRVDLKEISGARAEQLLAAYDAADAERRRADSVALDAEHRREQLEISDAQFEIQRSALEQQAALAETAAERREVELRLLDLILRHERAKLQEVLAAEELGQVTHAEAVIARERLRALEARFARERQGVIRGTMGPLESFLDKLPTTAAKANEALQRVAVGGLQSIEEGLLSILDGTKSVAEAFRDMATSIISDLLRIQIQRMITIPLANALGGLIPGGGGAAASAGSLGAAFAGGLPGFAHGGSFRIGGNAGIDRNILSLNGMPIARVSRGERVDVSNRGGGNTFNIHVGSPNSGDPRRDRQTMIQQAALVRDAVAKVARTGR